MLPHGLHLLERRVPELMGRLALALGNAEPDPAAASSRAAALAARAEVAGLSALGAGESHVEPIVAAVLKRAELANTPDPPGADELTAMLHAAL
jgi:alcohol dehydrogenase class IV